MNSEEKLVVRTRKNKSFGMIVQEYRQRNGWTQEELAWRAGVTREHIGRIERDKCNPSIVTVEQLEKAFHLPPMSLVRLKLNPEIQLFSDSEEEKCVGYACMLIVLCNTKLRMLYICPMTRNRSRLQPKPSGKRKSNANFCKGENCNE